MTKSKKKRGSRASTKKVLENPKEEINVEVLIEEAESAVDSFNYEEAVQKLNTVLGIDSNNTKALEILAGIHIEQSNFLEAENLYKKCIDLSPEEGFSKYFSMGQLSEGEESLAFYLKGIQILEKELENSENVPSSEGKEWQTLVRGLSEAYCSMSEIFMTDCCFQENAEEKCLEAIETAIKADPSNPDAYQCLANFHLVKEQVSEAKEDMQKSLALWLPHHEALRDGQSENASSELEIMAVIPTYDSRIQTSKLLIELEMFDEATNILEGLIEEDDEVVEIWYLLGWMNYMQGDEYKLNAHYYLNKAKEISEKIEMEEVDYINHIHELLEELKATFPLDDIENADEEEYIFESSSDSDSENKMET